MIFQDQLGRRIELSSRPERIVSLVPSQTELLVDLGLEENLVGITKFCVHPPELKKIKKIVGGTKEVHFDKIAALNPDIILCNKEENTKEMVKRLEKIAPVHVSDVVNLEDAFGLMRQYGKLFRKESLAETVVSSIQKKVKTLKQQLQNKQKTRVAYVIWKKPLMVAGRNTFINSLLELNNLENVFGEERYPVTSLEDLRNRQPEVVLLSTEPFPFQEKHIKDFSDLDVQVEIVDGEYFSWYGSRLLKAMEYFKKLPINNR
ncbi:MAG: helical backbone metal receptor [Salegentibacter sp.]